MSKDKKREYVREHPYKVKEKLMDMRYRRVKANANRMSKKELCDIIQKKKLEKVDDGVYVKKTYEIEELRFEYDLEDF